MKGLSGKVHMEKVELLILIIFLLINLRALTWFQPGYTVFSGDLRPPIVPHAFLNNALNAWNQVDWGIPSVYLPRMIEPLYFFMTTFQSIGIDTQTSLFLTAYFMYVLVSILVYFYVKLLTNGDKIAAFVGAIFFITNIYLIIDREQTAFGFMELSLIILPCLVTFTYGIKKKSFGYMTTAGFLFILTYAAFPNYRAPVLLIIAILLSLASLTLTKPLIDGYAGIRRIDTTLGRIKNSRMRFPKVIFEWNLFRKYAKHFTVFIAAILTSSIWFFTLVYANLNNLLTALSQAVTPVASAFGNKAPDVFRLIAQWSIYWDWLGINYVPYAPVYLENSIMIVLSYLPTVLAFAAILFARSRKQALFLGGCGFLFLILTCGSSEIFSQSYGVLMNAIPFLRAFRTSTNWIFLVILTFSMLIGLFASGVVHKLKSKSLKVLGVFLIIALLFVTAYPLTTGDVTSNWIDDKLNKGAHIPPYFSETENAMSDKHWTILLPQRNVYTIYNFSDKGYLSSGNPYSLVFSKPYISASGTEYLQTTNKYFLNSIYYLIRSGGYWDIASKRTIDSSESQTMYPAKYVMDANYETRWASIPGDPDPWISIAFTEPQTVSSVRIYFQEAYAPNFTITRYNEETSDSKEGTLSKETNPDLDPKIKFDQPMRTTKLRIDFYGHFDWELVSIYEIQIYRKELLTGEVAPKILGMAGIKNLLTEKRIMAGNLYGPDLELLEENPRFTLKYNWTEAEMYENEYSLEKFYPASVIKNITYSNPKDDVISNQAFTDLYEAIANTNLPWDLLKNRAFFSIPPNDPIPSTLRGQLQKPENFTWQEISSTKYEIKTNSKGPFLLAFLENFNSQWKTSVNGKVIPESDHVMVNDFGNGWVINETGDLTITVEYATQNVITYSIVASIIVSTILAVIVINRNTISQVVKKVKQKL